MIVSLQIGVIRCAVEELDGDCLRQWTDINCKRSGKGRSLGVGSADERGWGKQVQIPGAILCCICYCLSHKCHYVSTVQISPFSPNPSHAAADSLSDLV